MVAFLRILLIAVLVYYIIKFLGRFLFARFLRNFESKMNGSQEIYKNRKEGEVTVQTQQQKNNKSKDVGEYIDFEEIEPDK